LAIYNSGTPADCGSFAGVRANAWCGDNLAGLASFDTATGVLAFDRADAATPLPFQSPTQRFYVVDTPVSFICEAGEIRRYADYAIASDQPLPPAVTPALLATRVESCRFSYAPGTSRRAGLVSIRLVLAARNLDEEREVITLLQQVPVVNTP
jgi:MSHA biogenesis protein MshO